MPSPVRGERVLDTGAGAEMLRIRVYLQRSMSW